MIEFEPIEESKVDQRISSAPTRWGFLRVDETGRVLKLKKNTTRKKRPNLFFIFVCGSISGGRTKTQKSKILIFVFNFVKAELQKSAGSRIFFVNSSGRWAYLQKKGAFFVLIF